MSYLYAVRGWMELSWPDVEIEGVDESPEEHTEKVQRVRELLTVRLSEEELEDESRPHTERYKAGWCFPQHDLGATEYLFFGGDVEEPAAVLALIREVLLIDPYADGYFSIEGEDGERYRQWLIKGGSIYTQRTLFPDFDAEALPPGYVSL